MEKNQLIVISLGTILLFIALLIVILYFAGGLGETVQTDKETSRKLAKTEQGTSHKSSNTDNETTVTATKTEDAPRHEEAKQRSLNSKSENDIETTLVKEEFTNVVPADETTLSDSYPNARAYVVHHFSAYIIYHTHVVFVVWFRDHWGTIGFAHLPHDELQIHTVVQEINAHGLLMIAIDTEAQQWRFLNLDLRKRKFSEFHDLKQDIFDFGQTSSIPACIKYARLTNSDALQFINTKGQIFHFVSLDKLALSDATVSPSAQINYLNPEDTEAIMISHLPTGLQCTFANSAQEDFEIDWVDSSHGRPTTILVSSSHLNELWFVLEFKSGIQLYRKKNQNEIIRAGFVPAFHELVWFKALPTEHLLLGTQASVFLYDYETEMIVWELKTADTVGGFLTGSDLFLFTVSGFHYWALGQKEEEKK